MRKTENLTVNSKPLHYITAENLTPEDVHMLKHTRRQEPQGEEQTYVSSGVVTPGHQSSASYSSAMKSHSNNPLHALRLPVTITTPQMSVSSHRSNDSILSGGDSSSNTLIIHHSVPDEQWTSRWLSGYSTPCTTRSKSTQGRQQYSEPPGQQFVNVVNSNFSMKGTDSLKNNALVNSSLNSSSIDSSFNANKTSTSMYIHQGQLSPRLSRGTIKIPTVNDIVSDNVYSNQSEILKHLMNSKEHPGYSDQSTSSSSSGLNLIAESGSNSSRASHVGVSQAALNTSTRQVIGQLDQSAAREELTDQDFDALAKRLPPPPAYPHWRFKGDGAKSAAESQTSQSEDLSRQPNLSRSQPDLTKIGGASKENGSARLSATLPLEDEPSDPTSLKDTVTILMQENRALKMALNIHRTKISKLQKFEKEMAKVEEHHDAMMKVSERREQLERIARHKLQTEIKGLNALVSELREQLREKSEALSTAISANAISGSGTENTASSETVAALQRELSRRDVYIAQLVSQNKELIAGKERQEIELCAQRQTLNEQRTHIDILDNALTNAQTNVIKLEEEVRQKQLLADQCGQFKRLLVSMRLASDRREQAEKNLRHNLEMDILQLKSNAKLDPQSSEISDYRQELRAKDERIMVLESELAKWEQRSAQLGLSPTVGISDNSTVKPSSNSPKGDSGTSKTNETLSLNKKLAELETRNRLLESRNLEKESTILMLQKKVEDYQFGLSKSDGDNRESPGTASINKMSNSHQRSGSNLAAFTPRKDEELGYFSQLALQGGSPSRLVSGYYNHPELDYKSADYPFSLSSSRASSKNDGIFIPGGHLKSDSYCYLNLASSDTTLGLLKPGDQMEKKEDVEKISPYVPSLDLPQSLTQFFAHQQLPKAPLYSGIESREVLLENISTQNLPLVDSAKMMENFKTKKVMERSLENLLDSPKKEQCFGREKSLENLTNAYLLTPPSVGAQLSPTPSPPLGLNVLPISVTGPMKGDPPPYHSRHAVIVSDRDNHSPQPCLNPGAQPVLLQPELDGECLQGYYQAPQNGNQLQNKGQRSPQDGQKNVTDAFDANTAQATESCQSPQPQPHQASLPPQPTSPPLTVTHPNCKPHPPNVLCRNCQSVRRSHRQNAAALVRRAHSCQHQNPNRKSAPLNGDTNLDDAPSILERLKKEWEVSNAKKDGQTQPPGSPPLKQNVQKEGQTNVSPTKSKVSGGAKDGEEEADALQHAVQSGKKNEDQESDNKESKETKKKSVSHLDRALNRLSMKRTNNVKVHAVTSDSSAAGSSSQADSENVDKHVELVIKEDDDRTQ